jgi:hypothetical protein
MADRRVERTTEHELLDMIVIAVAPDARVQLVDEIRPLFYTD